MDWSVSMDLPLELKYPKSLDYENMCVLLKYESHSLWDGGEIMCKESRDLYKARVVSTHIAHVESGGKSPCMQVPHKFTKN